MKCKSCNTEIEEGTEFCTDCEYSETVVEKAKKTRTTPKLEEVEVEEVTSREERFNKEADDKKKKKLIMIGAIVAGVLLLIIIIVIVMWMSGSSKDKDNEEEVVDNKKIMAAYGEEIKESALKHYQSVGVIPNAEWIVTNVKYTAHKVECESIEIHYPDTINLTSCTVDQSKEKYNQEIKIAGISASTLTICHAPYDAEYWYSNTDVGPCYQDYHKNGKYKEYELKCRTDKCNILEYFDDTVTVMEKDRALYVYKFTNGELLYQAPAGEKISYVILNDKVAGLILTNEAKKSAVYNFALKKIISDYGKYKYEEGDLVLKEAIKTSLLEVISGEKKGLIDFKTGKLIIPIEYEYIFQERYMEKNYMLGYNNEKYTLFEADTGKILLGGEEYDGIAPISYQNGYALVMDGKDFNLLKMNGDVVKALGPAQFKVKYYESGVTNNGTKLYMFVYQDDDEAVWSCLEYYYDFKTDKFDIEEDAMCGI